MFHKKLSNEETIFYSNYKKLLFNHSRSTGKDATLFNYTLADSEELMNNIDLQKPYVLYIHGYEEHPTNESIQTVVSGNYFR